MGTALRVIAGHVVVVEEQGFAQATVGDLVRIDVPVGYGEMMRPSLSGLDVHTDGESLRLVAVAYTERRSLDGHLVSGGGNLSAFLVAEQEGMSPIVVTPVGDASEGPHSYEIQVGSAK